MPDKREQPVAAITGAYGGIGSALARRLHEMGFRLALLGRTQEKLDALAEAFGAKSYNVDATDVDSVSSSLKAVADDFGRLDAAANCVGSILLKPAHLTSASQWEEVIAKNLTSAFALVAGAANLMKDGGSIALVSSAAGRIGLSNHEAIASAKAGVEGLARSAAASYASRGIRVNAVAPGLVETPMTESLTSHDRSRKVSEAMHPIGRIGRPDDVARVLAMFLDPASDWITGQVLAVDGGMSGVALKPSVSK